MKLLFTIFRIGLGLALFLGTSGAAALCVSLALRPGDFWNHSAMVCVALFFGVLACGVWGILLFRRESQALIRVVTGVLGAGGMAVVAMNTYNLFSAFSAWKLLLSLLGLPGTAVFLLWAFHREPRQSLSRFGGANGYASALITWPRPTRPPALSAAAAEPLPRPAEHPDYHGQEPLE